MMERTAYSMASTCQLPKIAMFGRVRNASADGSSCDELRKIDSETAQTMSALGRLSDIGNDVTLPTTDAAVVPRQIEIRPGHYPLDPTEPQAA
jgi:hypothetical protein